MSVGDIMPVTVSAPEMLPINLAAVVCTCPKLAASEASVPLANPVILLDPIGMLAVGVLWPSLVMQFVRPEARSAVRALKTVAEMTVLATTGWPVELMRNVPLPLKLTWIPPLPFAQVEPPTAAHSMGQFCYLLRQPFSSCLWTLP